MQRNFFPAVDFVCANMLLEGTEMKIFEAFSNENLMKAETEIINKRIDME